MIKAHYKEVLLAISIMVMYFACANAPDLSEVPRIEYRGMSKTTLNQSNVNGDTFFLFMYYEDGDGDIGFGDMEAGNDIFIIDSRIGDTVERIKSPMVPLAGSKNGVRAEVTIKLFSTCCLFPDGTPPCLAPPEFPTNEFHYEILMRDRAGNQSNTVQTDMITLNCN